MMTDGKFVNIPKVLKSGGGRIMNPNHGYCGTNYCKSNPMSFELS